MNNWVRQGRGLVIIPGDNTQPDAYNRGLGSLLPMPIAKVRTLDAKKAKPLHIDRGTFSLPAFSQFKDDRYFAGLNDIQASKTLELTEPKGDAAASGGVETICATTTVGRRWLANASRGAK